MPDALPYRLRVFREGLHETGYVEGYNVVIKYHWADGRNDRLQALVADLVRHRLMVIAAMSASAALAARAATATIPIVFTDGNDPVKHGLVASLNQPGGNVTGVTNLNVELEPKRLQLMHDLIPAGASIGLLINPTSINAESALQDLTAAAHSLGRQTLVLRASSAPEIDKVFASFRELRAGALVVAGDNFFDSRSAHLGALTLRHAVPAIYQTREFAIRGGFMSCGANIADYQRRFGVYVGRILQGEKPAHLPVQVSTKYELVINLSSRCRRRCSPAPTR
jgi:putative tryptophan/tyrosine transport system substrate-binding protein